MIRAALLAVMTLLLGACGREAALEAFAESRAPPSLSARFFPPEGWAWGYIKSGTQPMQRYGVAAPSRVPVATVVIVPGYGESAEVWFETARDLIDRGYTVWILDRAGQGGSERYSGPRDVGSVTSFGPDVANLRNLVRQVVRPAPGAPVVLVSHADGVVTAVRALESGLRADGLIAASPALAPRRLAPVRITAGRGWSREAPDDLAAGLTHDPWRGQVRKAWQIANPDLRMAAPASSWRKAYEAASRAAEAEADRIRTPILMLNPGASETELCRRAGACQTRRIAGARAALHLESDSWRVPFLQAISVFTDDLVAKQRDHERIATSQ
jgi:lysophospholipase